jgi:sterol desaturase/sphingolipid hydroxylase (fatty acid hydroxylase superfamily)
MIHGVLFILYVLLLIQVSILQKWSFKKMVLAMIAALIPFGTFYASKKLYPSGSFSQCVWIPRAFNISLYTEDHTLHHSNNNCNYSKRFSLWDKAFGTYK